MGRAGCPRWLTVGLVVVVAAAANWVQGTAARHQNSLSFFPEPFPGNFYKWDDFKIKDTNTHDKVPQGRSEVPGAVIPSPGTAAAAQEPRQEAPGNLLLENFPDIPRYGSSLGSKKRAARSLQTTAEDSDLFLDTDGARYQPQEKKTSLEYASGRPDKESDSVGQGGSYETRKVENEQTKKLFNTYLFSTYNDYSLPEEGYGEYLFTDDEDSEGSGSGDHEGSGSDQEDSVEEDGSGQQEDEDPQHPIPSVFIRHSFLDVFRTKH
ncbi:uncharacterized protein LOC143032442 [Oratosquilla oratoria]|uniref:uncharacterized protein LOC143032442 n=1 Tax=Oratosquilla oratoria TaxID=337810 RepID=UPI003F77604F